MAGVLQGASVLSNAGFKHFILHDPKFSELELDDSEAEKIAQALLDLSKYYPGVDIPGVTLAWFNLAQAVGAVAVAHVGIYKLRRKNEEDVKQPRPIRSTVAQPVPSYDLR